MTKNEILDKVIDSLMNQRSNISDELMHLNHNETSFHDRKMTLENAIMNIDSQISFRIGDLELKIK
tara:strand:+ start:467 stop:664 length:198 start_codon:yes stop_codon:yes gene_type:complete